MTRTAEQIAADEELTEAVQRVCRAYDVFDDTKVALNFVISGYARGLADLDRREHTGFLLLKDNGLAGTNYEAEGLFLEGARQIVAQSDDVEGE